MLKVLEMKKIIFLALLLCFTQSAFSWSDYDTYTTPANQATQLKLQEVQRKLDQAEMDRVFENLKHEREAREAAWLSHKQAEDQAREATKRAEQAEQAAEELRYEMLRSSIKAKNNIYLGILLLAIGGFVTFSVTKNNQGNPMNANQKYGVILMIVPFLLILLTLMISVGWTPQQDYLENLMNSLEIKLFFKETVKGNIFSYDNYYIEISSKYIVLAFISSAAYGLTTYLGITPTYKPWEK